VERQVPDAVFAAIPDGEVYRQAVELGVGATLTAHLGGKFDTQHGAPVQVTAIVEHIHRPQPDTHDVGVATLRAGGVHIIVSERRKMFTRLDDFRSAGINPLDHKLVVVKLGYLFPELRAIAPREILTLSPGYADMDLTRLPFRHVGRPIYPLEQDFDWAPTVLTSAASGASTG
jgi:microcystin degradation protein MlrC